MAKRLLPVLQCFIAVLIAGNLLLSQETSPAVTPAKTAKTPTSAIAKPPGAIYKEAMHPLDVVRGSMDNWSDAELGALDVGIHKALEFCTQAKPQDYSGDDLYDLARLCSLGQDWKNADAAAVQYIASGQENHRTQAHVIRMNAQLQLHSIDAASLTAFDIVHKLPYDAEAAYAIRYVKNYLEQAGDPLAFAIADEENYPLLQALRQNVPLKATHGDAVIALGSLYESGMQLAFLRRYSGDEDGATLTVAALDSALADSSKLSAEDRELIEGVRTRYNLLDNRLPELNAIQSFQSPLAKARIDSNFGIATVLVLFPDWCIQCKKMMKSLTAFAVVNGDVPIHAYGLMFAESPKDPKDAKTPVYQDLRGTATLLVPPETAKKFVASDYPLGIVVDRDGLVRFIGTLPLDAFNGDGYAGKIITRMTTTAPTCKKGDARPGCQKPAAEKN